MRHAAFIWPLFICLIALDLVFKTEPVAGMALVSAAACILYAWLTDATAWKRKKKTALAGKDEEDLTLPDVDMSGDDQYR